MSDPQTGNLENWEKTTEISSDVISAAPIKGMTATLEQYPHSSETGASLPPCWHWLYFLQYTAASELAEDGHERLGSFLPPVPLPRRMWAGSRMTFNQHPVIGEKVERRTGVKDVTFKTGRSGQLAFITVANEISGDQGAHILDEHDIVYREAAKEGEPAPLPLPLPDGPQWSLSITPDPVMLFRYSALTFNGHRIHFDREFCIREEGYPGLVFHGPMTAMLLLEGLHRHQPGVDITGFTFRATAPLFDIEPFQIQGRLDGDRAHLWAAAPDGGLAMDATAILR